MIKRFLYIFILTSTFSCEKNSKVESIENNFAINIIIPRAKDDQKIFLKKQEGYLSIILDSTKVKKQKATFKGIVKSPKVYGIFIEGHKQGIFPIIEKGTINIKTNINDLTNVHISGTLLNDQLGDYKEQIKKISSKMNELFHQFQKARAENNSKKLEQVNQKMKKINDEKNNYSVHFVKNNPDSFVASMVLHSLLINQAIPKDTIAKLYSLLSSEVKKSEFSKSIALDLHIDSIQKDSIN